MAFGRHFPVGAQAFRHRLYVERPPDDVVEVESEFLSLCFVAVGCPEGDDEGDAVQGPVDGVKRSWAYRAGQLVDVAGGYFLE